MITTTISDGATTPQNPDKERVVEKMTFPKRKSNPWGHYQHNFASLESFAEHLGCGKWYGGTLIDSSKTYSNSASLGSQLVSLDFDKNAHPPRPNNEILSIEGVLELLNDYELVPNIIYKTSRHTEEAPRFRVIFVLNTVIPVEQWKHITTSLLKYAFAEDCAFLADSNCKDPARRYAGGKEAEVLNAALYDIDSFTSKVATLCADSRGKKQDQDDIYRRVKNGYALSIYQEDTQKLPSYKGEANTQYKKFSENPFKYQEAIKVSPVFADFANGEGAILEYDALFGLWLSIAKFKGGHKWFINAMHLHAENGGEGYKDTTISTINRARTNGEHKKYWEKSQEPLCEWFDSSLDPQLFKISDLQGKANRAITRVAEIEKVTLNEGQDMLSAAMAKGMLTKTLLKARGLKEIIQREGGIDTLLENDPEGRMVVNYMNEVVEKRIAETLFVIRAQTGIGKTELIIDILKEVYESSEWSFNSFKNIIIAFPTHKNGEEFIERLISSGFDSAKVLKTPPLPTFDDKELQKRFNALYKAGAKKKASELLKRVEKNYEGKYSDSDSKKAEQYRALHKQAMLWQYVTITTHKQYLNAGEAMQGKYVFLDEDILNAIENEESFSFNALNGFLELEINELKGIKGSSSLFRKLIRDLEVIKDHFVRIAGYLNKPLDTSESSWEQPTLTDRDSTLAHLVENGFEAAVEVLQSSYIMPHREGNSVLISGINKVRMPVFKNKVGIVLSATANEELYSIASGGKAVFLSLPPVENQGRVILNATKANSKRQQQEASDEEISAFEEEAFQFAKSIRPQTTEEDFHIITNKSTKHRYKYAHPEMHFGNVAGFDGAKGKVVAVVGMATPNPLSIMFKAKAYGLNVKADDLGGDNLEYKQRVINGHKVALLGFKNEELNKLIYHICTSEMVQANRARTIREKDGVVIYYGRMPTEEVDEILN